MAKYVLNSIIFLFIAFNALGQIKTAGRNIVREGNELYKEKKYEEAEKLYKKSLENGGSPEGVFNLGDALYKQGKYQESAALFKALAETVQDKNLKAKAYHNLGNSMVKANQLEPAVDAYKRALRNNPNDEDTRYNLAHSMRKMEEQQQQQDQQKDDQNKDDQKKDQDKKNQEQQQKDQEQKEKEEQQQQNQENQEQQKKEEQQQQKPEPDQISKEEAQRMLDALNNDEKQLQEKMKRKKIKQKKVNIEKDW